MAIEFETDVISVAQNEAGQWRMTVNGNWLGDTRSQATRDEAIEYAKKTVKGWANVVFDFDNEKGN